MQVKFILSLILILWISSLSALDVEGNINGIWLKSDSPIVVTDDVIIEELTIEAGVVILFEEDYRFEISGTLEAKGFFSDSICFKPKPGNSNGWQGLSFLSGAGESVLNYCKIEGAKNQGLLIDGCDSFSISNCFITNNSGDGIRIRNTSLDFNQTIIRNNSGKGIFLENAQLSINNSIISENDEGIYSLNAGDLVDLNNSIIADNRSKSILCLAGSVTITNSILFDNYLELSSSDTGRISATYSAIRGGEVYPGTGNINQDPDFSERSTYQLNLGSPCIDAGDQGPTYQDLYFPPSLGDIRNDMGAYGGPLAGNWLAPLVIEPGYVDFGKVSKDSSSSVDLWIKNYRDHSISVSAVSFSENNTYFGTDKQNFTIPASERIPLQLSFTPDQQYVFLTTMQLQTTTEGKVYMNVRGEGVVSEISILSPQLHFDNLVIGESQTLELGILNSGADTLRIHQIFSTHSVFVPDVTSLNIDPSLGIDTVYVTFTPDSNRLYQDSLILISNDPDEQRLAIPLSGTGLLGPVLAPEQQIVQFGPVRVLEDSSVQQIYLHNAGDLDLSISDIQLIIPDTLSGNFDLPNKPDTFPLLLEPDSGFTLQTQFNPLQRGIDSAEVQIQSNDPGNEILRITLAGIGISPVIETPVTFFNYDSVDVDTNSIWTLQISNQGDADLILKNILLEPEENNFFYFDEPHPILPDTIAPDNHFDLRLKYMPTKSGTDTALVKIFSDDPINNLVSVKLQGIGVAPQIVVSSFDLDFGSIPFDTDSSALFTIYNYGDRNLEIYANQVQLSGADTSLFQLDKNLHKDKLLSPGDSVQHTIQFSPKNLGLKQALLSIGSNDPANPQIQINLSGIGIDNQPAEISFSPPGSGFRYHTNSTMGFNISSTSDADSVHLFLRQGGQINFVEHTLTEQTAGHWSTNLDSAQITERGLEYFVRCWHGFRITDWPENGSYAPSVVSVSIPEMDYPWLTQEKKYQFISIPLNSSGQSLSQLFEDDLGAYDNSKYRIFDISDGVDYNELVDMNSPLLPGKSLFLITKEAQQLNVSNTSSVSSREDFLLQLKTGWNMIASPFAFAVDWSGSKLNFYTGNEWDYSTLLEPFKGYVVKSKSDTVIHIPPVEASTSEHLAKTDSFIPGEEWHIQIAAKSGKFYDRHNYAGVHLDAQDGIDKLDYPEPPPIGDFVSVGFLTENRRQKSASDYRQPAQKGYEFNFEILSNISGEKQITFESSSLPDDFIWAVFSDETGLKYDAQPIRIQVPDQQFKLIVGTEEYVAQISESYHNAPNSFKIRQNYPNPFNPLTRIKYQMPQSAKVTIEIYDLLGRRIKTLVRGQIKETGYHQLQWNGTNNNGNSVSAGIYFLQFRTKQFTKTIKMILQK